LFYTQLFEPRHISTKKATRWGVKLDRHDAVHAIASILVNHMYELLHGEDAALDNDDYYAELKELTAEKWSRGEESHF